MTDACTTRTRSWRQTRSLRHTTRSSSIERRSPGPRSPAPGARTNTRTDRRTARRERRTTTTSLFAPLLPEHAPPTRARPLEATTRILFYNSHCVGSCAYFAVARCALRCHRQPAGGNPERGARPVRDEGLPRDDDGRRAPALGGEHRQHLPPLRLEGRARYGALRGGIARLPERLPRRAGAPFRRRSRRQGGR